MVVDLVAHGRSRLEHRLQTNRAQALLFERDEHGEATLELLRLSGERVALLLSLELECDETREEDERSQLGVGDVERPGVARGERAPHGSVAST